MALEGIPEKKREQEEGQMSRRDFMTLSGFGVAGALSGAGADELARQAASRAEASPTNPYRHAASFLEAPVGITHFARGPEFDETYEALKNNITLDTATGALTLRDEKGNLKFEQGPVNMAAVEGLYVSLNPYTDFIEFEYRLKNGDTLRTSIRKRTTGAIQITPPSHTNQ